MTIETVLEFRGLFDRPYDISKSNIFQSWTPKADLKENVIFEKKIRKWIFWMFPNIIELY